MEEICTPSPHLISVRHSIQSFRPLYTPGRSVTWPSPWTDSSCVREIGIKTPYCPLSSLLTAILGTEVSLLLVAFVDSSFVVGREGCSLKVFSMLSHYCLVITPLSIYCWIYLLLPDCCLWTETLSLLLIQHASCPALYCYCEWNRWLVIAEGTSYKQ